MSGLFWVRAVIGAAFCFCAVLLGVFIFFLQSPIDFTALERYKGARPTVVLDDEGNEWTRFQLDKRDPITLEQVPDHVIQAFIAAEDWAFFSHSGISLKGIIRSTLVNLRNRRIVQGASTITQQLVKLLFFDAQRTFRRKINEQLLSIIIEWHYTKEQILELYLNHIYFGCGIYGIEAACQRFWGKHTWEITVDQAALLAAIVRSPGLYNPILAPEAAKKRRQVILRSMNQLGFIDEKIYNHGCKSPLLIKPEESVLAPHARESLRLFLESTVGKIALYTGSLVVQTTLNRPMQQHAETCFKKQCEQLKKQLGNGVDGGVLTIEGATGAIKVMVGGYNFNQSKFNRALQARRQMGSTFKPLIYTAALEQGMTFADTAVDEPIEIVQGTQRWAPKNANRLYAHTMTYAYALSHSNNIVAIKTLLAGGFDPVIALAKKCHITAHMHPYPSLALGCIDVTLKEVVGMFNMYAHHGTYCEPHMVTWIKDAWGKKIYNPVYKKERVIESRLSDQVARVLALGLERVRAWYDKPWLSCAAISKTGTTNESRTCWYTGSTPDYTTSVYIGFDDNRPLGKDIYPLTTAFPIWLEVMREVPIKNTHFVTDPALQEVWIHEKYGYRVRSGSKEGINILM